MGISLLTLAYLIGSVTFILGLKMLSHPDSARKGNLIAAAGMIIAIFGTIFFCKSLQLFDLVKFPFIMTWHLIRDQFREPSPACNYNYK